ncbi:Integrase [Sphingomonas sp. YR710]|uniref:tyrosine-type recombinase/integrase n=1 Tax=Sphingomonas sp. YR710 TaxID=1882773 RepID=UPI00088F283D|nr:site-specific integrase [Sphingomonas sp. YR710]SDD10660.1 Integrase [Sphingomonas sp. YR710]
MGTLSATGIRAIKTPGRYHDGGGLMLVVGKNSRSWIVRIKEPGPAGRRRDIGLGSAALVTLAEARGAAVMVRRQVLAGIDPVVERRRALEQIPTFRIAATKLHGELKASWKKDGKHHDQWLSTLETHVFPSLGDRLIDGITGGDIRDVLLKSVDDKRGALWLELPETARRVRQRIGAVLDWARANGFRETEAPLRSVNRTLPRQPKSDGHFAAMAFSEVPDFMKRLRERDASSRWAVEAAILTATRSGEIRGARWVEFDFEAGTWTIPANRMKAGKVHVVPLSASMLALLKKAKKVATGDYVFPGQNLRKPMSNMTMTKLLRDMGVTDTVHGFRSAFRDWVAEETTFPAEVAEAALAHAVPDKVVAAYKRTDFLAKRRQLMAEWASYCEGAKAKVVRLPRRPAVKG